MALKSILKKLAPFSAAFTASWLVLTPVWADDTEIFFADTGGESIWPNVLFIIDTSGSMDNTVYETDASGNSVSTGKDRLEHVQDAFRQLLSELSNVNVGLMRFSNPGGPVLYPVYDIDADVSEVSATAIIAGISADNDDAQELSSGTVIVDNDYLYLTQLTLGLESFSDFISEGNHDAEEDVSDGDISRSSDDLDFRGGSVGSRKTVGLHFNGSEVPKGAIITKAFITFTAFDGGNASDATFTITGEPDDTGSFDTDGRNISSRDDTLASISWTLTGDYDDGQKVTTPNLVTIVQEIVSNPAWDPDSNGEDDMTFFFQPISGSGEREFASRNGADSVGERPQLQIEYYMDDVPVAEQSITGLRFQNIGLPRGVTVTNAYIEFNAAQSAIGNQSFSITAEETGTPAAYAATDNNLSSGRSYVASPVPWTGSDAVIAGETFQTPNIASLVQTVAARNDWCGGNDMAFKISGTEGLRTAWSHDGDPSLSPRLIITYDYGSIPEGATCYRDTISRRVSASTSDAEEDGGSVSTSGNTLNMESGNNTGVRFDDIQIPKGSTILSAYIEFTEREEQDTGDTEMTISVENTGDAEAYTGSDGTIDGRNYSATTEDWDITDDWYEDRAYNTPDIKDLVSVAVGHADWVAGNAMSFKFVNTGSRDRRAYSFNSSPGQAPRLVVEYAATTTSSTSRKVRDELISVVDSLSHNGWTPVQDTMYEASQYYAGENVLYGAKRGGPNDSGPHSYTRVSHEASMVPGSYTVNYPSGCSEDNLADSDCEDQTISTVGTAKYTSPIDNYCQKTSHIVLLTDGYANKDHSTDEIQTFIDSDSCTDSGTGDGGACVQDLAKYMRENDMSGLKQDQKIITHTIGFNFASQWLKDVADAGGGKFIEATSSQDLVDSISALIVDMMKVDNTFVAPVAAVNQFNRLNHLEKIYFAVFRPDEYPRWPGNVKKYGLGTDNAVTGKNGTPVVDTTTGFFKEGSSDLWDAGNDPNDPGSSVEKGGAASQLATHSSRKIYTYHSNSTTTKLSDSSNRLHVDEIAGDGLTKAMFNATALSDEQFEDLIQWTRGKDVEAAGDVDRYSFGDPLHSRPVAVTYNVSEDDPDVEIFVGSNAGSLQAFDEDGKETFAFFPEATLPLQSDLKDNKSTWPHGYGIDGNIVPWIGDNLANGIDLSDSGDFVHLFFGMRRGGYNYYSVNVTDRANPYLNWIIEGGSGDFGELGQTWATPIPGRISLKDEGRRDVLFIGGGYDPIKDDLTTRADDTAGRAIFIVDAVTGERIWSASPAASGAGTNGYNKQFVDMKYSIPSTLTVADTNSDGLDDIIIVGDTGGQVWRFDIIVGNEVDELVKGGVIADLGVADGDNTEERNRRFYHAPDIALSERNGDLELAISIGSGFRPSPLSEVTRDRFFMLRQPAVFGPPDSYTKITESDLYDTTDNRVADGIEADGSTVTITDEEDALSAKKGWYIDLHDADMPGEKVLSTPITFRDQVAFVTYTPSSTILDCEAKAGISRVYFINLEDGSPIKNWSEVAGGYCEGANCSEDDRAYQLKTPSIIDEPVFICTGEGCTVFTGAEQPPIAPLKGDRIIKTYWRKDS